MTNEELKTKLSEYLPAVSYEEGGEWLNVNVPVAEWAGFAKKLRICSELQFDYLFCCTCVDWKTHLIMVYHFSSTQHRHNIVIKVQLDREQPRIATVCNIWRTTEMLEREVYEMFGVEFSNHPDLRKLILPDDWKGYPLRKDYSDPINMINL